MSVGYVYDDTSEEHDTGDHEENQQRLVEIMRLLEGTGQLARLVELPGRAATKEELTLVHSWDHIAYLERFVLLGGGWITADTVMSPGSFRAALHAAGSTVEAVEAVLIGEVESAFALVRPPGHHARPNQAMGFCFFNNISIAARYAQERFGLERILIVDFDVHHGNGTQEVFYEDPRVLYFSTHEHPLFPGTGAVSEVGSAAGRGFTVNVPLPSSCGDHEHQRVFDEVLWPAARRFDPQLVLVSAGYDSHWADPLALMNMTAPGFGRLVRCIRDIAGECCQGRLALTLEGGYHRAALPASVKATFEVLTGHGAPLIDPLGPPPLAERAPEIDPTISAVKAIHRL